VTITLSIESYGEKVVERVLSRFADDLAVPTVALQAIAGIMREETEAQFDTEGEHASGGWKPLARSTLERKERLGLDHRILRATGRLFESLTQQAAPDHIERLSGDSLVFGSAVPYGIYHQSSRPRTRLPYRPPVALNAEAKKRIVKTAQRALVEGMRTANPPLWGS
jgi:phage gpG-like protein